MGDECAGVPVHESGVAVEPCRRRRRVAFSVECLFLLSVPMKGMKHPIENCIGTPVPSYLLLMLVIVFGDVVASCLHCAVCFHHRARVGVDRLNPRNLQGDGGLNI